MHVGVFCQFCLTKFPLVHKFHKFSPWKLSTLSQLYLHDSEIELGIFNKEHTNTYLEKLKNLINL